VGSYWSSLCISFGKSSSGVLFSLSIIDMSMTFLCAIRLVSIGFYCFSVDWNLDLNSGLIGVFCFPSNKFIFLARVLCTVTVSKFIGLLIMIEEDVGN
jgi:hypothetical protein